jgi:hypothetical protein
MKILIFADRDSTDEAALKYALSYYSREDSFIYGKFFSVKPFDAMLENVMKSLEFKLTLYGVTYNASGSNTGFDRIMILLNSDNHDLLLIFHNTPYTSKESGLIIKRARTKKIPVLCVGRDAAGDIIAEKV